MNTPTNKAATPLQTVTAPAESLTVALIVPATNYGSRLSPSLTSIEASLAIFDGWLRLAHCPGLQVHQRRDE